MLAKIGLSGGDTRGGDRLDLRILTEEPEREVDIMDGAVDKYAAREFGIGNKETGGVELIACLAPEY